MTSWKQLFAHKGDKGFILALGGGGGRGLAHLGVLEEADTQDQSWLSKLSTAGHAGKNAGIDQKAAPVKIDRKIGPSYEAG